MEAAIREAFADVSPDGRDSLGDAYQADYMAPPTVDWRDEDTRWQQVPADALEYYRHATDVFTFGNTVSFRYYLPAFMLHELRSRSFFRSVRALDLDLPPGTSPTELERVRVLSPAQREAVVRFLRHVVTYAGPDPHAERALARVWEPTVAADLAP